MDNPLLKSIPKTDLVLVWSEVESLSSQYPHAFVKNAVRASLDEIRQAILHDKLNTIPDKSIIIQDIKARLAAGNHSLKRVINATGTILHTNLGRAPLGDIVTHIAQVASGYNNLEYDLENHKRGSRYSHVEKKLCDLTGAEAAMVVNNNAGAVFLILNTLAKGKNVAISRGELVEIGGSFRVPEIMEQSGANLIEVGTTNKTHDYDFTDAIRNRSATILLKVHTSNFSIKGFTDEVSLVDMTSIAHSMGCISLYDAGAAFMFAPEILGLHSGMIVKNCIECGTDVVCFSGDKLFGSAQAGIIVGKKSYIERMKKNHLTRMLRIDKLSLAALDATLDYYVDPNLAKERIPMLNMTAKTSDECKTAAEKLLALVNAKSSQVNATIEPTKDEVGGGALPNLTVDGFALRVESDTISAEDIEKFLQSRSVPIITRINKDGVLFSVRTLFDKDYDEIADALMELFK